MSDLFFISYSSVGGASLAMKLSGELAAELRYCYFRLSNILRKYCHGKCLPISPHDGGKLNVGMCAFSRSKSHKCA